MFLIIYARIVDNKKKGLKFSGPFFGPEAQNMKEAHIEASKIASDNKDHILIKIYDLDEHDYYSAKEEATNHFDRIYLQMKSAQILCDNSRKRN